MLNEPEVDQKLLAELEQSLSGLAHLKYPLAYNSVGSTNDEALRLEKAQGHGGTVIMAERQENGRGRRNRTWRAGSGDIIMSILLRRSVLPKEFLLLPFIPAVAILRACLSFDINVSLKWPNDIIFMPQLKKLGGILIENVFDGDGLSASIIGIGLNIEERPDLLADVPHAGFLRNYSQVNRKDLLKAILTEFDKLLPLKAESLLKEYEANCATIGRRVWLKIDNKNVQALAKGINKDGALVVNDGIKDHLILAGDINFSLEY